MTVSEYIELLLEMPLDAPVVVMAETSETSWGWELADGPVMLNDNAVLLE